MSTKMSFLDFFLAAGMARAAAEARDRPPPDNIFVLPSDPEVHIIIQVILLQDKCTCSFVHIK